MYNQLPYYIILEIIQYIEPCKKDFANFRAVCRRFASITRDKRFNNLVPCGKCTKANVYDTNHIACLLLMHKGYYDEYILLKYIKKSKLSDLDVVEFLMNRAKNFGYYYYSSAIKIASAKEDIELLKFLLGKKKSRRYFRIAMISAASYGRISVIKFLDEQAELSDNNFAILVALKGRHYNIVRFLIDKVDTEYRDFANINFLDVCSNLQ